MLIDTSFRRLLIARLLRIASASTAAAALGAAPGCSEPQDEPQKACVRWEEELGACPEGAEAWDELSQGRTCEEQVVSVDSHAAHRDEGCCYEVTVTDSCCYENCPVEGRPFMLEGRRLTAAARAAEASWLPGAAAGGDVGPRPAIVDLTGEEREVLAGAWLETALEEHASVASFARFGLDLMALGAPSALVEAAHSAALDEIGHARRCFSLASAYRGEPVGPGAFPFPPAVPIAADLAALARATAEEGCVGETVAALLAAEKRARAEDPAVRETLDVIAQEEARHAELAWLAVRWAIEVGGEAVRHAVAEVFEAAARELRKPAPVEAEHGLGRTAPLAAHGHLAATDLHRLSCAALNVVVLPSARALGVFGPTGAARPAPRWAGAPA